MTDFLTSLNRAALNDDPASSRERDNIDSNVTIVVCRSCLFPDQRGGNQPEIETRPGYLLAQATIEAAAATGIAVRQAGCLGNCSRGVSAAVLRRGCWSYLFGELGIDSATDLIAGAKLFAASTDGFMPFRARPEALKQGLIARIPSFENLKDLP